MTTGEPVREGPENTKRRELPDHSDGRCYQTDDDWTEGITGIIPDDSTVARPGRPAAVDVYTVTPAATGRAWCSVSLTDLFWRLP